MSVIENPYRRTLPSFLERELARLVKRRPAPTDPVVRLDILHGVDLEFRQA